MAKRRPPVVHGTVVVDKPEGMTSHDVVGKLRKTLGERRVGHAGTLDPDATGVLVVGVGRATRLMQWVTGADKDYSCELVLGSRTSTLDDSGEILETFDMSAVSIDDARRVIRERLVGDIEQVPPMVSALKVDGKRLHEYAREGVEVERKARRVHIERFDVEATSDPGVWVMNVTCSSGTYVRSLGDDLGRLLGGGAHIRRLRRHRVGRFGESMCSTLDEPALLAEDEMVSHLARVDVDESTAARVANGAMLAVVLGFGGAGPWRVHGPAGALLAVYEVSGRFGDDGVALVKPSVVLAIGG
ncbi:MAG: tRNA pseudouridine(55) synthase TruB [Actinomycetota bacterium]|jgi:tRNA pseudouridine55 synthase